MHQHAHKTFDYGDSIENAARAHSLFPDNRTQCQRDMDKVNERSALCRAKNAQVQPYKAKDPELEYPPVEVMIDRVTKPLIKATVLISSLGTILAVFMGAAASAMAWMAANGAIVTGVIAAGVGAAWVLSFRSRGGSDNDSGNGSTHHHHHYHQENHFGGNHQENRRNG